MMQKTTVIFTDSNINDVFKTLSKISKIAALDEDNEPQAYAIVHAFSELEESFRATLELFLALTNESDSQNIENIVTDIGEEFRHILYHITDIKFYDYLLDKKQS